MGDYGDPYMRKDQSGPPGRTKAQNRATVQQLKLVRRFSGFVLVVWVSRVWVIVSVGGLGLLSWFVGV